MRRQLSGCSGRAVLLMVMRFFEDARNVGDVFYGDEMAELS